MDSEHVQGIVEFLKSLGAARIAAMAAVTVALVGFFAVLTMRVTAPQMTPLFTDLTFEDSAAIIKDLDTDPVSVRREFVHKELEIVGAMHRAGVPLLAGTDTAAAVDVLPGFSLHQELEYFVQAGLSPMEALQTATLNPARFFGMEDQLGTIEKDKLADLVLLTGNPLDNIANTQKIAAVISNGHYFSSNDLQKMLAAVEAAAHDQLAETH